MLKGGLKMIAEKQMNTTSRSQAFRYRSWMILTMVLNAIYLYWRVRYTLPIEYGVISIIAGVSLLVVEFLGALESLVHYFNMHRIENHPVPEVPLHLFPDVDIFIATYTEPIDLLYKTINGCKYLDYPDKAKVHIHLCDDGRRPEARQLAMEMGINYICREDNKGAKAGNLNHAMSVTSAPLIVTLDADMIPQHSFLMRCVPYFVDADLQNASREDGKKLRMGFVQTPQSFYNPDLFQFFLYSENRIPNEQDYFYKDVQVSRNRSNSVIYGGSNTMLSRAAIEDIGGFFEGAITEDFATGILLQKKGYICYANNEVLASGLSPTDLPNLIQQRIRWARGCIQTGRKMHIILSPELSFGQKANYWASIWYWYAPLKRLSYIMSPILFAVFGFMVIKCTLLEVLIFWLPMYISSNITLRMLSRGIRTTKWTSIYETVLFPFMLFPVLAEFFGISLKKFRVTKKEKVRSEKSTTVLYAIPFVLLAVLSVIGIINCTAMIFQSGTVSPIVVLFWLSVNLFNLVMALFFTLGRNFYRMSERVAAVVECRLGTNGHGIIHCETTDFSETGVALFLKKPTDIDENETVNLHLLTDRYSAKLKGRIVHVSAIPGGWKYAFLITDYGDSKSQYLQIVYDRVPTLPTDLKKAQGSYNDIRHNITRRTQGVFYQNRRYPRINMDETIHSDYGPVHLINFNYKFVVTDSSDLPNELYLHPVEGLALLCRYERDVQDGKKLYAVANYDDIHNNAEASRLLSEWVDQILRRESVPGDKSMPSARSSDLALNILGAPQGQGGGLKQ